MSDGPASAPGAPPREPRVDRRAVEIPELLVRSPDAVMLFDAEARVLDVNEEACRSLGYAREELLGKQPDAFVEGLEGPALSGMMTVLKERGVATFDAVHRSGECSRARDRKKVTEIIPVRHRVQDRTGSVHHQSFQERARAVITGGWRPTDGGHFTKATPSRAGPPQEKEKTK